MYFLIILLNNKETIMQGKKSFKQKNFMMHHFFNDLSFKWPCYWFVNNIVNWKALEIEPTN